MYFLIIVEVFLHLFPNSYFGLSILNVVALGGEVFKKQLGHEGGFLMNGINTLIKETPDSSNLSFWQVRIDLTNQQSTLRKRAFTRIWPCRYPDPGLLVSRSVGNNVVLFRPFNLLYIVIAAWTE